MSRTTEHALNPRRVAAGKANRQKRGPLTEAGRERLRAAAFEHKPWRYATGPRTPAGKAQSVQNGKQRQRGVLSVREQRAVLTETRALIRAMRETCEQLRGRCGVDADGS